MGVRVPQARDHRAVARVDPAHGGAVGPVRGDLGDPAVADDDIDVLADVRPGAVPEAARVDDRVGRAGSAVVQGDADGTGAAVGDVGQAQGADGEVEEGAGVGGPGRVVGGFGGELAGLAVGGAVGADRKQPQRGLGDDGHPAAVRGPDGPGVVAVGERGVRGEGVQGGGAGGGVDDPDEVEALAEALVDAVAVAEGDVPAVGRPAGAAGETARAEGCREDPFGAVGQVAHHEVARHVQAGQPGPVGREGGEDPAALGEHGLRPGVEVATPYGEQPVAVVGVHQCRAVGCPGRRQHIAGGRDLENLAGWPAARRPDGPQRVERGEGDGPAVG